MSTASTASRTGRGLGTTTLIAVTDPASLSPAVRMFEVWIARLDRAASRFRADSELTAANRAAGRPVRVGPLLRDALAASLDMAEATDGLVDPLVGASVMAAGYDVTFDRVMPGRGGLRLLEPLKTTWADVRLEPDPPSDVEDAEAGGGGAWLTVPAGGVLDLGAVAKAWLADRVADQVSALLGCGVLVDLGGDLSVGGPAPDGGWLVGLPGAGPASAVTGVVAVHCGGLATSSQAGRRWITADGPAHHIIDPRTGRPADSPWRAATVAAATAAEANAGATAAIVLGAAAPAWLAGTGLDARLLPCDGSDPVLAGRWPQAVPEQFVPTSPGRTESIR